jgi:hypothetical protein
MLTVAACPLPVKCESDSQLIGGGMRHLNVLVYVAVALFLAGPLYAKEKETEDFSNVFNVLPDKVYEAAYRYAQHHGTIKYSDDKHMTITATIYIPGGKWSYRKDYECTISVQPSGTGKSTVDIVGLAKTSQTTFSDLRKKNAPSIKVLEGIREELERSK